MYAYIGVCMYMCGYTYIYIYTYICIYICMYECVCANVSLYIRACTLRTPERVTGCLKFGVYF